MKKGIFWIIDNKLFCVSVCCNNNGVALENVNYSAKSGENFNHKCEWEKLPKNIRGKSPYNYYPRGRVEIKNKKAVVYLNPFLNTKEIQQKIIQEFELKDITAIFKSDGSVHYQAIVDNF